MAWLAWRQHRLESAVAAGVIALVATLVLVTGLRAAHAYDHLGVAACIGRPGRGCAITLDEFGRRFSWLSTLRPWLNFVPAIVAVLLAAPFVQELEQGTYRLAWTQGIGRGRWLAVRLGYLVATALAAGALLSVLLTWWRRPFDPLFGRIDPSVFDFEGVVPLAYVLFGVSLVVAIGAVTRRSAIALAAGFGAFIGIRLAVMTWVRPHLLEPVTLLLPPLAREPAFIGRGWALGGGLVDGSGRPLNPGTLLAACPPTGKLDPSACFQRHGVLNRIVYHPAGNFWGLQAIEASLFLAASAVLLGLAVWWIRRRLA
jgi:hypothetical protein